jgi:hypothetical protein
MTSFWVTLITKQCGGLRANEFRGIPQRLCCVCASEVRLKYPDEFFMITPAGGLATLLRITERLQVSVRYVFTAQGAG